MDFSQKDSKNSKKKQRMNVISCYMKAFCQICAGDFRILNQNYETFQKALNSSDEVKTTWSKNGSLLYIVKDRRTI